MALNIYYLAQLVFFLFAADLYGAKNNDWSIGIVDQSLILVAKESTYWIINLLVSAAIIFIGPILLSYALSTFGKDPFWEVKIRVSWRIVVGCLSSIAVVVYLIISGNILDLVRFVQRESHIILVPATVFALTAALLISYLSPKCCARIEHFLPKIFFRKRYDYREIWMRFSERSSGSLNLIELLPRVGQFIADSMFVRQVAVWLRSNNSETFVLAYLHESSGAPTNSLSLRLRSRLSPDEVFVSSGDCDANTQTPFEHSPVFERLDIKQFVIVKIGTTWLGIIGVGANIAKKAPTKEDNRFLASLSNQLAHLIMNQRLSEELLLAREWESFNRFSSFILHDLKNLATLQSMTLENAKNLSNNTEFLTDAFSTFGQTTDKMINLIASLSAQRGQLSLNQQPLDILPVIRNVFEDLKIEHRKGIKLMTKFPAPTPGPIIFGDPELLKKAFTNILLNAIQSLRKGEGLIEIKVTHPNKGKIITTIEDTGCGMSPEQLQGLFRPFRTSKKQGMGIGLCHTRSIIEVHGGHIHIESEVNAGTKVEIELPTIRNAERNGFSEAQNTYN
jgi:putative PEP-CTERM system histidine kinase